MTGKRLLREWDHCGLSSWTQAIGVLTKIIIELSNIGTEKSQTVARKTACQITQRNCSGEAGFSAQFSVLSEQRTSNDSGRHSFKVSKNRPERTRGFSVALATGKGVLLWRE